MKCLEFNRCFLHLLLNQKKIAEAPAEVAPQTTSEPEQEEDVTPPVIDPVLLSLVHQSIVQQHAILGELPVMTVKTEHVSPI